MLFSLYAEIKIVYLIGPNHAKGLIEVRTIKSSGLVEHPTQASVPKEKVKKLRRGSEAKESAKCLQNDKKFK